MKPNIIGVHAMRAATLGNIEYGYKRNCKLLIAIVDNAVP